MQQLLAGTAMQKRIWCHALIWGQGQRVDAVLLEKIKLTPNMQKRSYTQPISVLAPALSLLVLPKRMFGGSQSAACRAGASPVIDEKTHAKQTVDGRQR